MQKGVKFSVSLTVHKVRLTVSIPCTLGCAVKCKSLLRKVQGEKFTPLDMSTMECPTEQTLSFDITIPKEEVFDRLRADPLQLNILLKAGSTLKLAGIADIDLVGYLNKGLMSVKKEAVLLRDSPDKRAEADVSIHCTRIGDAIVESIDRNNQSRDPSLCRSSLDNSMNSKLEDTSSRLQRLRNNSTTSLQTASSVPIQTANQQQGSSSYLEQKRKVSGQKPSDHLSIFEWPLDEPNFVDQEQKLSPAAPLKSPPVQTKDQIPSPILIKQPSSGGTTNYFNAKPSTIENPTHQDRDPDLTFMHLSSSRPHHSPVSSSLRPDSTTPTPTQLSQLHSQLSLKDSTISTLQSKLSTLEHQYQSILSDNNQLKATITALRADQSSPSTLKTAIQDRDGVIASLSAQLEQSRSALMQMDLARQESADNVHSLTAQLSSLQNKHEQVIKDIDRLQVENKDYKEKIHGISVREDGRVKDVERRLEEANRKIILLEDVNNDLRENIDELVE